MSAPDTFERYRALGEARFPSTRGTRDALPPFDRSSFQALGRAGLFRSAVAPERGGEGLGLLGAVEAPWGFAEGSGDLGLATSALAQLVAVLVLARRSPGPVADRWIPRLISGEAIASVANAEPAAGTDILGLRSRARPSAGGWVLSGRKRCITNAPVADVAFLSARVLGVEPRRAISCFALELPAPRCWSRTWGELVGLRSSPTGDLVVWRAPVAREALIGEVGGGVALFREVFALERLFAGGLFLAALRRCQRRALAFVEARSQSGQPIGRHQLVQERVVQMRVAADLMTSHLRETARAMDAGRDVRPALSAIKVFGLEAAQAAVGGLRRLLGSRGLSTFDWAARMSDDLAVLSVFGGTVELHKRTLYADLLCERDEARGASDVLELADPPPGESAMERELVGVVARAFLGEARLEGRYVWDRPSTRRTRSGCCGGAGSGRSGRVCRTEMLTDEAWRSRPRAGPRRCRAAR